MDSLLSCFEIGRIGVRFQQLKFGEGVRCHLLPIERIGRLSLLFLKDLDLGVNWR